MSEHGPSVLFFPLGKIGFGEPSSANGCRATAAEAAIRNHGRTTAYAARCDVASNYVSCNCGVHGFSSVEDLLMHFLLIVVPNAGASPRKDGSNRQEEFHLPRLKDSALRIDERNPRLYE